MAKILVVDNEKKMCLLVKTALELENHEVFSAFSGEEAISLLSSASFDIVISDLKMSPVDGMQVLKAARERSKPIDVILMTAYASQETALEAMKTGAYDYLIKPFKMDELIIRVERILKQKELEEENRRLKAFKEDDDSFPGFIGKSAKMRKVFQLINQVSRTETTVLIRGESGTGKELAAEAIHRKSERNTGPFIAINCAALPENLLESELFGYEKGAFTGADQRKEGMFERAQNGTIFLDEIGDMPLSLQAKLLRVLQNNEIVHLGGHEKISVNFRLITATNRNLEEMIDSQQFRTDLYYRINVFPINLPALRERKEDIPELVQYFSNQFPDKSFSQQAIGKLMEYDYPGNVRELQNIITRAALVAGTIIEDVDFGNIPQKIDKTDNIFAIPDEGINIDELEKKLIEQAVKKAGGNKSRAAQLLGVTRRRLYSMMERFGIEY
jgi:DNA-binding NtrC family response regulator